MSNATQVPTAARRALLVVGALLAIATPAQSQTRPVPGRHWEVVVPGGWLVPTGDHRSAVGRGRFNAVQAAFVVRPALALTATVGWARTRDLASPDEPKLDVFTYDLGAEFRTAPRPAGPLRWGAFAGVGAGARSYNHRSLDVDATHNVAAYAGLGGEVGFGRVRLRVEARDYVAGYRSRVGAASSPTSNDVALLMGLRVARR